MFTRHYFVIALACGSCNNKLSKNPALPLIRWWTHVHSMICLLFSSQNHVPTPIVPFMTDAQYSKHFQRSGKWSYVFLEWIATYISSFGAFQHLRCCIYLRQGSILRESNTEIPYWILQPIYLYNIFQTGTRYFLLKLLFFFKFWPTIWQSSSTFCATILCYFCIVASRLACKPHLEEIQ